MGVQIMGATHQTIGIDLAKNSFYLVTLDKACCVVERKKRSRAQLLEYLAQIPESTVAMEACASSHYWARSITKLGHSVELLPAQHVKGYSRGQKNDYNDAQAIAEASHHGAIRPVPTKTVEQQDDSTFIHIRQQLIHDRTRLANHLRGVLAEYGIVMPVGLHVLQHRLAEILEDADNDLTYRMRELLHRQHNRLRALDEEIAWYDEHLRQSVEKDAACQRMLAIPGVGDIVAHTLKQWMGDGQQFSRGRDASAALGLVPRQHSTGGKPRLLGISKKGDASVRSAVIHGARAVVSRAGRKNDVLSRWIQRLVAHRGFNRAVVAYANKMVRFAWVVVAKGERFLIRHAASA